MTLDSSASLFASLSTLVFPEYQNAHPGLVDLPLLKFYILSLLLICGKNRYVLAQQFESTLRPELVMIGTGQKYKHTLLL